MKKTKNKSSILGIIVGAVITIFSIIIFSNDARFGGDFYTEIYNICRLGFGFLIMSIGLTDICYFSLHLYNKDEKTIVNVDSKSNDHNDCLPDI